jgi:hypothetical protein
MRYRLGRLDAKQMFPEEHPGRTSVLEDLEARARKLPGREDWRSKKVGDGARYNDPFPLPRGVELLGRRLARNAKNQDPDRFYFRGDVTLTTFIVQELIEDPGAEPPSGAVGFWHPKIVDIYRVNFSDEFKARTRFGGAYNCRANVLNARLWSMHSNWPPVLAIDTFCSPEVDDKLRAAHARAGIDGIIYVYHFGHQHAQVGSNRSGRPECAP